MRIDCFPCVRLRPPIGLYDREAPASEGVIAKFMRRIYAPFLLRPEVKQFVLAAFGGLLLVAVIGIQHITLGLGELKGLPSRRLSNDRPTTRSSSRLASSIVL